MKSIALPSITGIAASGPMLPRPSTAVPSETTATVWPLIVSVQADSGSSAIALRDARDARRVGHREVVAGLDRDLRPMISILPPLCIRNVRSETLATVMPSSARTALTTRSPCCGVDAGDGHVTGDAALVDAHEVDRAEDRALGADRVGHAPRTRPGSWRSSMRMVKE